MKQLLIIMIILALATPSTAIAKKKEKEKQEAMLQAVASESFDLGMMCLRDQIRAAVYRNKANPEKTLDFRQMQKKCREMYGMNPPPPKKQEKSKKKR